MPKKSKKDAEDAEAASNPFAQVSMIRSVAVQTLLLLLQNGAVDRSSLCFRFFLDSKKQFRAMVHLYIFSGYGEARGSSGACLDPQEIGRCFEKTTGFEM